MAQDIDGDDLFESRVLLVPVQVVAQAVARIALQSAHISRSPGSVELYVSELTRGVDERPSESLTLDADGAFGDLRGNLREVSDVPAELILGDAKDQPRHKEEGNGHEVAMAQHVMDRQRDRANDQQQGRPGSHLAKIGIRNAVLQPRRSSAPPLRQVLVWAGSSDKRWAT